MLKQQLITVLYNTMCSKPDVQCTCIETSKTFDHNYEDIFLSVQRCFVSFLSHFVLSSDRVKSL